jgi:hypothetical protein
LLTSWSPQAVDDTVHFADSQAAARWEGNRLEAGVTGGIRSGNRFVTTGGTGRSWASASVIARLTRFSSVVASAGTYPMDLAEGFPGGRFASVGIRFGTPRASRDEHDGASRRDAETARAVTAFRIESAGAGRWRFRVHAPGAHAVELNADFTSWQPVALVAGPDGWWTTTLSMGPGSYQMNVRVDGGQWLVPPGLVAMSDEFGGAFGVLTVR